MCIIRRMHVYLWHFPWRKTIFYLPECMTCCRATFSGNPDNHLSCNTTTTLPILPDVCYSLTCASPPATWHCRKGHRKAISWHASRKMLWHAQSGSKRWSSKRAKKKNLSCPRMCTKILALAMPKLPQKAMARLTSAKLCNVFYKCVRTPVYTSVCIHVYMYVYMRISRRVRLYSIMSCLYVCT